MSVLPVRMRKTCASMHLCNWMKYLFKSIQFPCTDFFVVSYQDRYFLPKKWGRLNEKSVQCLFKSKKEKKKKIVNVICNAEKKYKWALRHLNGRTKHGRFTSVYLSIRYIFFSPINDELIYFLTYQIEQIWGMHMPHNKVTRFFSHES